MKNLNQNLQHFRQSMGDEFELMHNSNNESFESSPEGSYWRERLQKTNRKNETYRNFKSGNRIFKKTTRKIRNAADKFKSTDKWYGYDGKFFDYEAYEYVHKLYIPNYGSNKRIYCPICRKTKFIFSSRKKADNFIRFNADEIERQNGYKPIRSYYCSVCKGWHTTHQERLTEEERTQTALHGSLIYNDFKNEMPDVELEVNTYTQDHTPDYREEDLKEDNTQEIINNLINEIELSIEDDINKFNELIQKKDVKQCRNINGRLRRIFSSFEGRVPEEVLSMFTSRLDDMSRQIEEVQKQVTAEEERRRTLVHNMKRIFKKQMQLFTKKYALGKYDECRFIYESLSRVITPEESNLPVMKELRQGLKIMETRLNNCGELGRATA